MAIKLSLLAIEEIVFYLGVADLCEMRMLNKTWFSLASSRLFKVMSASSSPADTEHAGLIKKYGKNCRILNLQVLPPTQEDGFDFQTDFHLFPIVTSLRLLNAHRPTFSLLKSANGLNYLRHISVFGTRGYFEYNEFAMFSQQLTSLYLFFPKLKSITTNAVFFMLDAMEGINAAFPVLTDLHMFERFEDSDYTLYRVNPSKKTVISLSAGRYSALKVDFTFFEDERQTAIGEKLSGIFYTLQAMIKVERCCIKLSEGFPATKKVLIRSKERFLIDLPEKLAGVETIELRVKDLKLCIPRRAFTTSAFILRSEVKIQTGFLSWISEHFPILISLDINSSVDRHQWKGTFGLLECFISPTVSISPLSKIIRQAPCIKEIKALLNQTQISQIRRAHPNILYRCCEKDSEEVFDFELGFHTFLEVLDALRGKFLSHLTPTRDVHFSSVFNQITKFGPVDTLFTS
ncbi:hypothetical protein DSO57_1035288 [Entomophthora muscae]|uniref:Uncharacterized protein n=1 Tax=Entomophthora muscae TaxID=34485 RepID=A0ACC2SCJ1_9FUNG|nr:hypothetical protein DSO57_1035288 [Entomophthora muscae]